MDMLAKHSVSAVWGLAARFHEAVDFIQNKLYHIEEANHDIATVKVFDICVLTINIDQSVFLYSTNATRSKVYVLLTWFTMLYFYMSLFSMWKPAGKSTFDQRNVHSILYIFCVRVLLSMREVYFTTLMAFPQGS